MPPTGSESLPQTPVQPLIAVIDTCVFPRKKWLDSIRDAAQAGYLVPVWSPLIIAEVTRLLTWQWLHRHRGEQTPSTWARCSADAKAWFTLMTAVFRVAEDAPPLEDAWESPRDEWDLPLLSAAKRYGASFIVTENLQDGPPEDHRRLRIFDGILWCHPDLFLNMVNVWSDFVATGSQDLPTRPRQGSPSSGQAAAASGARGTEIPVAFLDFLDGLAIHPPPNPTQLRTVQSE